MYRLNKEHDGILSFFDEVIAKQLEKDNLSEKCDQSDRATYDKVTESLLLLVESGLNIIKEEDDDDLEDFKNLLDRAMEHKSVDVMRFLLKYYSNRPRTNFDNFDRCNFCFRGNKKLYN